MHVEQKYPDTMLRPRNDLIWESIYENQYENQFTWAYVENGAKDITWEEHRGENGIGGMWEMSK